MAGFDVPINLILNGGSKIDKIINQAAQLESIINDINKKPLVVNVTKVTSAFDTLESNLKATRSTLLSQQKAVDQAANSIDSYTDQIVDLQRKLNELNPNTKKYNDLLNKQNEAIKGRAAAEKEVNASLERIEKTQRKLVGLEEDTKRARVAKEAAIAVENLADSYLRLGSAQQKSANESSIASLSAQAEALKLVANNSQVASSQFNRFAIATQAASQKIFEARQKQLGALAFGLSPEAPKVNIGRGGVGSIAGARGLVGSLIASGSEVVKSEAALSDYAERLRVLQSLVPYASSEFSALGEVLAGVNQELSQIGKKSAPLAISGPATDLGSLKAFQLRESFQKKINDQLNRQDSIQERISQASLFDFQKKKLTLQLDEAVAALAENRLGDAQRLTREIDRQRISMERMNRAAQKPQVFGALGTAFMPVTGELPGGNVPGSPAAKAAEAKANRESTQAAVALAKQKQKAIEDEAEELRKGTQAATALGKQKLKALQDEAERLRQETSNAVALAQQKMREEERAIAQAWKMRGGPALPPSMGGGTAGVRGQAFRAGGPGAATAALSAPRRVESLVRSAQLAQEKLLELEIRGVDVTGEKASVQKIINSLKEKDLQISDQLLNNADDELNLIRDVLRLEKQRLTNQRLLGGGGAGAKAGATGTGLEQALKNLQEARGARQAFLGGASPAQAIDQIVREFNKGQPAQNVTGTFADGLLGGSKEMATAATTAFTAALEAIKKVFGIASPSRVMKEIASNLISSFIAELVSNIPSVKAALEQTFTAKDVDFEQPGRGLPRRAPLAAQIDPGYLAALSGAPLTPGRPSPAGIFPASAARVGAPGSAFPFQTYDMSFPQFPVETAAQLKPPSSLKNRPGDTSRILSAAIKEYRAAVDNFWEGEDSQFEAIKKIVVSSGRLAAAQLARRLQQAKDLTPDQQFQQTASEARSLLSPGRQSGVSRFAGAANDLITGERRLGVSEAVGNILQRISDSVLNSIEALGFSVSNSFEDGIDRIRSGVPNAISRGLSAISGGFGGGPGGGGGTGGGGATGGGGSVSQVAQLLGFDAIADISRVSTRELEALSAAASELRAVLDPTIEGFDRLDNQLRETIGQIGRQIERRAPEADFLTRRFGPRGGRAVSEGLIGGAFPLLFGQGVGAAAGGGLGGALGGFAGGGLGFGLSLAGTALGTAFDAAVQGATELGAALSDSAATFDKVKERALFSSKETEKFADKLQEAGLVASSAALSQQEIIGKIGISGVNSLNSLADSSDKLNRAWAEFNLQLQAALAGPMAGLLEWVASIVGIANQRNRSQAAARDVIPQDEAGRKKFEQELTASFNKTYGTSFKGAGTPRGSIEDTINFLSMDEKGRAALAELTKNFPPVELDVKIKKSQEIEEQIAVLSKRLEIVDISKSLKDQVRSAAREQQDLDKQRADLVRSYEESIGNIRKQVEDEIRNKRFATLEKENQLLDIQGQIRLKQLQIANQAAISQAGVGQRPEVEQAAKEVAQLIAQFSEQQVSAEEEAASIKRNAAVEVQKIDSEAAQFKANIEKEVSRLNIDTARRVADINEQVGRRNEEFDKNRFTLEKRIAQLQLKNNEILTTQQLDTAEKSLAAAQQAGDQQQTAYAKSLVDIYQSQLDIIQQGQEDVAAFTAPQALRGVGAVGGGGVSTAGVDRATADYKTAVENYVAAQLRLNELDVIKNAQEFTLGIAEFASKTDAVLNAIQTRESDAEIERLRYLELLSAGLTDTAAERVIELETTKRIALATYDVAIAQLDSKIIAEATTDQVKAQNKAYQDQIKILKNRKNALEGRFGQFNTDTGKGTGAIGQAIESDPGKKTRDFILQAAIELNDLESLALRVSRGISDAIGNSIANGITGLIEGTASAKEVFAGFLKDVGQILLQEATKMIATYIAIGIARMFAFGSNNVSGGAGGAGASDLPTSITSVTPIAANGAYFANGVAAFANGGMFTNSIVSSPTLFQFADGGAMRTGVMGEAGPEAIMPLRRGPDGRLGVEASVFEAPRRAMEAADSFASSSAANSQSLAASEAAQGVAPGAGGSITIQTQVINNVEYATVEQVKEASAASARKARSQVFADLKNRPASRQSIGVR